MANPNLKYFYNSKEWKLARLSKLISVDYICEECGAIAEEVHHIIEITSINIFDQKITIDPHNLVALCRDCHNKKHDRFKKNQIMFDKEGNYSSY